MSWRFKQEIITTMGSLYAQTKEQWRYLRQLMWHIWTDISVLDSCASQVFEADGDVFVARCAMQPVILKLPFV